MTAGNARMKRVSRFTNGQQADDLFDWQPQSARAAEFPIQLRRFL